MKVGPLVTIVTVCLNSESYIADTIRSVANQTYTNIEYIIVDGGSTDATVDIIKSFESCFDGKMKWLSEKDQGLYDAMNKGIRLANGEIIGLLNSDDWYCEKAIETVVSNLENGVDIYYGDIYLIREVGGTLLKKFSAAGDAAQLVNGMSIKHPACFIRRDYYDVNTYDINYKISADYKLLLEAYLSSVKFKYINQVLTYMRIGGLSAYTKEANIGTYRIQKELIGKKKIYLLLKGLSILNYTRFRNCVAERLPSKNLINQLKTRKWVELDDNYGNSQF